MVEAIYRDAKRRGIYPAPWTDPEGDSCFSIYQMSWIKIKKELLVHNRRHLRKSSLNWQCFGVHFYDFVANSVRKFFLPTSKHRQAKLCLFLGICWYNGFIYRWNLIWIPSQISEYPRIFRVTGANQNARKLLFTDLANTKTFDFSHKVLIFKIYLLISYRKLYFSKMELDYA